MRNLLGTENQPAPGQLLAFCSKVKNKIDIIDIKTKKEYASFYGVPTQIEVNFNWTLVKEIADTRLLVSWQNSGHSVSMEIFNISQKRKPRKIYSFKTFGGIAVGDVTYNSRRSLLCAISQPGQTAFHIYSVEKHSCIKLLKKSRWNPQYCSYFPLPSFELDPEGISLAAFDYNGKCFISNVDSSEHRLTKEVGSHTSFNSLCRWSINVGEPLIFLKYDVNSLNLLDVEKNELILQEPIKLADSMGMTYYIDICPINSNLLASGGTDKNIKIYDRRESKIVKAFEKIHSREIMCVRWSPDGTLLASTSYYPQTKVIDFKTGKVVLKAESSLGCNK